MLQIVITLPFACFCCILPLPYPGLSIFPSLYSQSQLWVLIPRRAPSQKADYPSFHLNQNQREQEVLWQAQASAIQRLHRILNWKHYQHPHLCVDTTTVPPPSYYSENTPRSTWIPCLCATVLINSLHPSAWCQFHGFKCFPNFASWRIYEFISRKLHVTGKSSHFRCPVQQNLTSKGGVIPTETACLGLYPGSVSGSCG